MRHIKFFIFLIAVVITLSWATGCSSNTGRPIEEEQPVTAETSEDKLAFEDAVQDPSKRDEFINQVVQELGQPYFLTNVNYVDTQEELDYLKEEYGYEKERPGLMLATPPKDIQMSQLGKQLVPIRISIFPRSFNKETILSKNDFVASLKEQYYYGKLFNSDQIPYQVQDEIPGSYKTKYIDYREFLFTEGNVYNKPLMITLFELASIRETIHGFEDCQTSPTYYQDKLISYIMRYAAIWDYRANMDEDFIERLKFEFFEDWILDIGSFSGLLIRLEGFWYVINPLTGTLGDITEIIMEKYGLEKSDIKPKSPETPTVRGLLPLLFLLYNGEVPKLNYECSKSKTILDFHRNLLWSSFIV